jgi:catechol 2,3-dioxygenase-like lactoylglutathione lyase family enzyme
MPEIVLDAVAVTSRDMAATIRFYSRLGFEFPPFDGEAKHVEPVSTGGARLMIDDAELIRGITGREPRPASHSTFALRCRDPAAVDRAVAAIRAGGFSVAKEPWNAVWGQRYAIVTDPDGYMVDLYAPLPAE